MINYKLLCCLNRLESTYSSKDGTTTYTYDNNGNTLSEVSKAKTTTYEYNSLNELISTNDGNKNVTFAYDGNRLRISKSIDGTTLQFLNDRDSVIAEILGTEVTASYLRGINLIAMIDPQGEFEWYYHFNYHGDVTELTDATGTVVKSYKYDAFGIEENIDPNDINPFRYTAEYFDKETGTIYLRARYYDPEIGRFLNQDSYLGNPNDPLSLNLYTYTHNNPVMGIDSSGHETIWLPDSSGDFGYWMFTNLNLTVYESTTTPLEISFHNGTEKGFNRDFNKARKGINEIVIDKKGNRYQTIDDLKKLDKKSGYKNTGTVVWMTTKTYVSAIADTVALYGAGEVLVASKGVSVGSAFLTYISPVGIPASTNYAFTAISEVDNSKKTSDWLVNSAISAVKGWVPYSSLINGTKDLGKYNWGYDYTITTEDRTSKMEKKEHGY